MDQVPAPVVRVEILMRVHRLRAVPAQLTRIRRQIGQQRRPGPPVL
jgi:hypothetical protein